MDQRIALDAEAELERKAMAEKMPQTDGSDPGDETDGKPPAA